MQCGVPQGSILGPLLYLLYVNDISKLCRGNILSFADDTTLYMSNSNLNELFLEANSDLSKAFDVINHDILLKKLNTYGICGNVNNWLRSYLSDRKQFVDIDGNSSNNGNMQCGVPQGSILGPLLYLLYVNDISKLCRGNILSFADDTTLYMSNSNLNELFLEANSTINELLQCFCANRLSLNPTQMCRDVIHVIVLVIITCTLIGHRITLIWSIGM